jgi:hypothetical protein
MLTLAGLVRANAGTGAAARARSGLVEAEFKVKGALTVVVGLALLAAAAALLIAPDALKDGLTGVLED